VHAEDFFVDDCCHRQTIEAIDESLPELNVIPSLTLIVEAVNAVDRRTFMVSPKNEKVLRIPVRAKIRAPC
jgi:hypothetical protein